MVRKIGKYQKFSWNKIDLDKRAISKEEANEYAKSRGFKYIETSVKDDINVEETLVMIAEDAYKNKEDNKGLKLYEHQLYDLKLNKQIQNHTEKIAAVCVNIDINALLLLKNDQSRSFKFTSKPLSFNNLILNFTNLTGPKYFC